jgi:hypothetical protein
MGLEELWSRLEEPWSHARFSSFPVSRGLSTGAWWACSVEHQDATAATSAQPGPRHHIPATWSPRHHIPATWIEPRLHLGPPLDPRHGRFLLRRGCQCGLASPATAGREAISRVVNFGGLSNMESNIEERSIRERRRGRASRGTEAGTACLLRSFRAAVSLLRTLRFLGSHSGRLPRIAAAVNSVEARERHRRCVRYPNRRIAHGRRGAAE